MKDCPDCSVISSNYREGPLLWFLRRTGRYTLLACCPLSRHAPVIHPERTREEAEKELAEWWEDRRKQTKKPWVLEQLDKKV